MTANSLSEEMSRSLSRDYQGTMSPFRVRLGAVLLAIAGILFVLYPLVRPFSNEATLQGAAAFASSGWVLAHMFAVVGFISTALGLLSLYNVLQRTAVAGLAFFALVVTWIGVGFTLPYYGAEIFGLHAIGQEAIRQHSTTLLALVDTIRYGPAAIVFGVGLSLLAVGPLLAAIAIWRSGKLPRWSGVLFALGFLLYFPQFFGNQSIRVAHGVLVALGCIWLAWSLLRGQQTHS